jgi:predicted ABC-type ATPase
MTQPKMTIIAGPNGCGKSTLAEMLINKRQLSTFLNADIIASGLGNSRISEIESGRVMLKAIKNLLSSRQNLAFETTLSGKLWVSIIEKAKKIGYQTEIYFIYVTTPEVAINRVAERVSHGGHNIPEQTIIRRYPRSINNFRNTYQEMADKWWLFNNTTKSAIMIANKLNDKVNIIDDDQYQVFNYL